MGEAGVVALYVGERDGGERDQFAVNVVTFGGMSDVLDALGERLCSPRLAAPRSAGHQPPGRHRFASR